MISAGTTLGVDCAALVRTGATGASISPDPTCLTTPLPRDVLARPLLSPVATPLPKPALATTPRVPRAPPVPLPYRAPLGRAKLPAWALVLGRPLLWWA